MVQRISSDLWVAAYLRKCRVNGAFAYLAKRGAANAGAIFVKIILPDGTVNLFGPAPQAAVPGDDDEDAGMPEDSRIFELIMADTDAATEARLASESRFDPDIWVIEVEDAQGRHALRLSEQ